MGQKTTGTATIWQFPHGGRRNLQRDALRLGAILERAMHTATSGIQADVLQLARDRLETARQRAAVSKEQGSIRSINGARFLNPFTPKDSSAPSAAEILTTEKELADILVIVRKSLDDLIFEKPNNIIGIGIAPIDPTGHA